MIKSFKRLALSTAAVITMGVASPVFANLTPYSEMPAGVYTLDKTHASLTWKVSHIGLSDYTARFTKFDSELTFDPANPEASSVTVTIDPTSIKTDYPYPEKKDFDKKLIEGEEWFNSLAFPEITFTSTSIEKTGENTGKMTGDLSFLGMTKPLTLDVTFNGAYAVQPFSQKPAIGFSAHGILKRSEWGFDTYVPNIGDDVELLIEVEYGQ